MLYIQQIVKETIWWIIVNKNSWSNSEARFRVYLCIYKGHIRGSK